jgi:hypothetical protein
MRLAATMTAMVVLAACGIAGSGGDPSAASHPATQGASAPSEVGPGDGSRGSLAPSMPAPAPGSSGAGGSGGTGAGGSGGEPNAQSPLRLVEKLELPLPGGSYNIAPGFALLDLDGDGDLDVFLPMEDDPSYVWRNDGDFVFTRVDDVGIPTNILAVGSALGDCDGDGRIDLLITGKERTAVLHNVGGRFEEIVDAGVTTTFGPGGSVFFDADGDGDLDLFVPCYWDVDQCRGGHLVFLNDGTCHFRNDSGGRFPAIRRRAHAAAAFDFDDDGDPDILVASDLGGVMEPDLVLENDGTGHFTDAAARLGLQHKAFSMSTEVADIDGDGLLDVYMGNICRNPLALGQGPGQPYVEADERLGVSAAWFHDGSQAPLVVPVLDPDDPDTRAEYDFMRTYARDRPDDDHSFCLTSWSTEAADLDADGRRELLVVNGSVGQEMEGIRQPHNLFWRPPGEEKFVDVAADAGIQKRGFGRTGMFADLDGDGRLDLLIGNIRRGWNDDAPGAVYRNTTPASAMGHHLFVDLRGPGPNVNGIGAVVELLAGGRHQIAYRTFSGSLATSSAAPLHFGLGTAETVDEIVVRWPWGGGVDRFRNVPAGSTVTLVHGSGR